MKFKIKARGEGDLKTRYRPQRLSEICPTFHMKDARAILEDPNASRVWLFEGLTGCGKTSLARLIARASVCNADSNIEKPCLQCEPCKSLESSPDYLEINGADVRGIDAMREITTGMRTYPGFLNKKIYVFDECFSEKTLVATSSGPREIRTINPGDAVFSLNGLDSVKRVFKNKVPLSRTMKLTLSDGRTIFTTKEHRFWTNLGWVEAQHLQKQKVLLFDFCSNMMSPHTLPDKLSRRCWEQEVEDRSRDRWKGAQYSQGERARQEEGLPAHPTRVERSEVYERGGNDDSFSSVIGDREHSQGFVEFYDLEMNGHPSFFANRICVHNCQQITSQAQELLNKVLEEPPEDSLIFLCTTNKKGLKRTLLGRCSKINFRRITKKQCGTIIGQVFKDAKQNLPDQDTTEDIFRRANGSVRDLLVILDGYLRGTFKVGSDYVEDDISVGSPDIFKLVKGYINKDWNTVRKILTTDNVKNDPDGYRETVCAFLARDALKYPEAKLSIASALGHLGGSLWEEPKREQHSLLVLRSLRACYQSERTGR
jgi:DNA polymerase III gamma/tau subunit